MINYYLQRLARLLDRPLFPWKGLVLAFSFANFALENWLAYRQYGVLKRTRVPKALEHELDQKTYDKSQAYGRARAEYGFVKSAYNQLKHAATLYYDLIPKMWALTGLLIARYAPARFSGEISHSLVFVLCIAVVEIVVAMPWEYYNHFVLEARFGFNKMTLNTWLADTVKGLLLGIALGGPVLGAVLAIIQKTGQNFFYYVWLFIFVFSLLMQTLYPMLIVPVFNKLTPLKPGPLKQGVERLASKLRFPLSELYVMDGSKRSAHSNAYFSGVPWKKTIVIYDTLLDKSDDAEVEGVLAHELGHWKLGHTTRLMATAQAHTFYTFALFAVFIGNASFFESFGFYDEKPVLIALMLFNEVLAPVDSVVMLLMNTLTRRYEFQADEFAAGLGYSQSLATALIKLQKENLTSMEADWLYSTYHYSHPILTERLNAMGYKSTEPVSKAADSEKPLKAADREL